MSDLLPQETSGSAKRGGTQQSRTVASGTKRTQKDWTIKGLPSESVEVARDAARQSGMKINAWVSQAFSEAAAASLPRRSEVNHVVSNESFDLDGELRKLRIRNDELLQTINNLSTAIAKMCQ